MKNIDLIPTWVEAMPLLFALLESGSETGKAYARLELMGLARKVDALNRTGGAR